MAFELSVKKVASVALIGTWLLTAGGLFAESEGASVFETSAYPGIVAPNVSARAVVVMDAASGAVLYAKNPYLVIPPASLTKLVTLHLV